MAWRTRCPTTPTWCFVLGPINPLQAVEVEALRTYLLSGGSLFLAFEPKATKPAPLQQVRDPLEDLIESTMGVKLGEGVLADERNHLPLYKNKLDRQFIGTNAYTSHASINTLAAERADLFVPVSGWVDEVPDSEASVTFTVRSLATTWADLDGDLEYKADQGETKTARNMVAAVTGGSEGVQWRAIVSADASIVSDWALGNDKTKAQQQLMQLPVGFRGNMLFINDATNWLIGAEALSGTTESEEDVKIKHTKDDQTWWFYSTTLGVPLLVMAGGFLRVRMRKAVRTPANTGGNA